MSKFLLLTKLTIACQLVLLSACSHINEKSANMDNSTLLPNPASTKSHILDFSKQPYTIQSATYDGKTIRYRAYENIVYVANPVDSTYQNMNIYIPDDYFANKTIDGFTKDTAPIFFTNNVGGYMPAKPATVGIDERSKQANSLLVALSKGYVVASAGARGRTTKNSEGVYTGKAPNAIIDLKSAVRYLKFNDKVMLGDANKIISNGTSAGGALSVLLGATGNQKDYEPYLKQLGSAPASDDIFAVSAYCPITDLEHADMAYEWQFNGVNDYQKMDISMLDFKVERKLVKGTLTAEQIQLSNQLKPLFPDYINQLQLKDSQGKLLVLDKNGHGSFKDLVTSYIVKSAQNAINSGEDLSKISWVTVHNNKVTSVDFSLYNQTVGRQKTPPAFDAVDLSAGENQLFGTEKLDSQHFTDFSMKHSRKAGATLADSQIIKMMNPLYYLAQNSKTPKNWRIRVGTNDRDTSLAIATIVATKLQNQGRQVDFAMPWGQGHGGDYDLEELFAWIKKTVNEQ